MVLVDKYSYDQMIWAYQVSDVGVVTVTGTGTCMVMHVTIITTDSVLAASISDTDIVSELWRGGKHKFFIYENSELIKAVLQNILASNESLGITVLFSSYVTWHEVTKTSLFCGS